MIDDGRLKSSLEKEKLDDKFSGTVFYVKHYGDFQDRMIEMGLPPERGAYIGSEVELYNVPDDVLTRRHLFVDKRRVRMEIADIREKVMYAKLL